VRRFDASKAREELLHDASQAWRAEAAALNKAEKRAEADEIIANLEEKSDEVVRRTASQGAPT
jgi:hypothetical protein